MVFFPTSLRNHPLEERRDPRLQPPRLPRGVCSTIRGTVISAVCAGLAGRLRRREVTMVMGVGLCMARVVRANRPAMQFWMTRRRYVPSLKATRILWATMV
jgi:hypothetical protein